MVIAHIIAGDLWAGAEAQVFTLIKELSIKTDVSLHIILFNHGELERRLNTVNCNVIVFSEKKHTSVSLLLKTIKYLKQAKPDLIHTHKQKENIIGAISGYMLGVPTIRTFHGASEHKIKPLQLHKYLYRALNDFIVTYLQSGIIAVSHQLSGILSNKYPHSKLWVIPNGIEPLNNTRSSPILSKDLPVNQKTINIAIICRLVAVKRVDIFIKIAHKIISKYPTQITFSIYGDGPLRSDLLALNGMLNLNGKVIFKGFIKDMSRYMNDIDLLLITSDHEGLPMNLLEAIQYKIPVLAHNVGDISSVLCGGKCGTIIYSQDISDYVSKLEDFITDPNPFYAMAEDAYKYIHDHYSAEKMMREYFHIYKSTIDHHATNLRTDS